MTRKTVKRYTPDFKIHIHSWRGEKKESKENKKGFKLATLHIQGRSYRLCIMALMVKVGLCDVREI